MAFHFWCGKSRGFGGGHYNGLANTSFSQLMFSCENSEKHGNFWDRKVFPDAWENPCIWEDLLPIWLRGPPFLVTVRYQQLQRGGILE